MDWWRKYTSNNTRASSLTTPIVSILLASTIAIEEVDSNNINNIYKLKEVDSNIWLMKCSSYTYEMFIFINCPLVRSLATFIAHLIAPSSHRALINRLHYDLSLLPLLREPTLVPSIAPSFDPCSIAPLLPPDPLLLQLFPFITCSINRSFNYPRLHHSIIPHCSIYYPLIDHL